MNEPNTKLAIGVIGCGHWGPNHIRVFSELERSRVLACADSNPARLEGVRQRFPKVRTATDYRSLLDDPLIDAVVIATPTGTHARLATEAIQAGKHVLLEKPMCATAEEAAALARLADDSDRVLMIGHVFLFNGGINKLREIVATGELGRIHYLDAVRTNLGPVRGDVNALFDLGTHDISIFNYLLGAAPTAVSAQGSCITQADVEDVCFATLHYPGGTLAHLHVSWLNPRKVRTLTVVGSRQMAHWDDINPDDTLRLYDKGLDEPPFYNSFGEFQYILRSADVRLPAVRRCEPLLEQARAFTEWVLDGTPRGPGPADGLAVVRVLEAAARSLRSGGSLCAIDPCGLTPTKTVSVDTVEPRGVARRTAASAHESLPLSVR
ncbi:MAG: Gfo/Idh/MocA family oxidoreductase [Phycisphaerales bacterium]|nr:Gfo/Idh/MocA family oxidoreductase [Phycisphaerales bacterium]